MSRFLEAQVALEKHLAAMPSAPPISFENENYTPTLGTLWLRATNLPSGAEAVGIANNDSIRGAGIFQIDVFAPLEQGIGPALTVADAIAEHFSRGGRLVQGDSIVTRGVPTIEPARTGEAWLIVSVLIPYDNLFRS